LRRARQFWRQLYSIAARPSSFGDREQVTLAVCGKMLLFDAGLELGSYPLAIVPKGLAYAYDQ
jgi:hypothetical protein